MHAFVHLFGWLVSCLVVYFFVILVLVCVYMYHTVLSCSYSTEVYFTNGPVAEQLLWLKQDLNEANRNRDKQPWIIAFGHRPMYCSNLDGDDCTTSHSVVRAG